LPGRPGAPWGSPSHPQSHRGRLNRAKLNDLRGAASRDRGQQPRAEGAYRVGILDVSPKSSTFLLRLMRHSFLLFAVLSGCSSAETTASPPAAELCSPAPAEAHRRVIGPPEDASFGAGVDVVVAMYLEWSPVYVLEVDSCEPPLVGARVVIANASRSAHFLNVWSSDWSGIGPVADGHLVVAEFTGERWEGVEACEAGADPTACAEEVNHTRRRRRAASSTHVHHHTGSSGRSSRHSTLLDRSLFVVSI